ncbi:hypothetical protein [Cerasicoccus fimbriatus]|uniref:hypothetical protein n=1 Tax=Cerasicoccus fimbriatus TaxID=3014554 RepID=UPI0022B2D494|nr:hypothetical protein [Cerasicoccus sp. TK19100]
MKNAYLDYYIPLVQQFCQQMQDGSFEALEHLPQPFLPLFGTGYEQSAFKLLFVGQDTKGWGSTSDFIERELKSPGECLEAMFGNIEGRPFTGWGKSTNSFFGFVMALLASVHGIENWNVLKWGGHEAVLSSFGWANANAVELWPSLKKHESRVPKATLDAARHAAAHLNRLKHMLVTLKPRVVLITFMGLSKSEFFEDLDVQELDTTNERFHHYRIDDYDVDIFHTCHPGYMRNYGGPWGFLNELREILRANGFAPDFPEFVSTGSESESVLAHLFKSAPTPNGDSQRKYELVAWVAKELNKHGAFMSVPSFVQMANELGYRTDYGTEYSGGRGSYRLIRGAYWRYFEREPNTARAIAEAFRKPDFTYAY